MTEVHRCGMQYNYKTGVVESRSVDCFRQSEPALAQDSVLASVLLGLVPVLLVAALLVWRRS